MIRFLALLLALTLIRPALAQSSAIFANGFESAAPIVLYTDIQSGPLTGGQNNKGVYLSIFGKHFGSTGLGTRVKVFLGDAEVDQYLVLTTSRGRPDIQQISVQLGALGGAGVGSVLPIRVLVDGIASNSNLTFTVHPGNIYFVDPASGVDNTNTSSGGGFADPFRTVQKPGGVSTVFTSTSAAVGGAWGRLRAGDFLVLRAGDYQDIGFGGVAGTNQGYFLQTLNKSGCALGSNCTQGGGNSSGPITIMGYPGENAVINRINTQGNTNFGGGISSADSARQAAGYGSRFTISNLQIESGFTDGAINVQLAQSNPLGAHWRIINNELTNRSCQVSTLCRAGAIAGSGIGNIWLGNYGHEIYDQPDANTSLENHGVYIGGGGSFEIAYNVFADIPGGNGVQVQSFDLTVQQLSIHHNVIKNVGKHGLNFAAGVGNQVLIWNNVISDTDFAGARFGDDALRNLRLYHNTFYNVGRVGNPVSGAALTNDTNAAANMFEFRNNIFWANAQSGYNSGCCNGNFAGGAAVSSHNLWFGAGLAPSFDATAINANPQFANAAGGDFRLLTNSPAIDTGSNSVTSVVNDDFEISTERDGPHRRPNGAGVDRGAFEFFDP
jgi:hypothetical protein